MGDGLVNFYLKLTALTCSTSSGWADHGQGVGFATVTLNMI